MGEDGRKYQVGDDFLTWEELEELAEKLLKEEHEPEDGVMLSLEQYAAHLMSDPSLGGVESTLKYGALELYLRAKAVQEGRDPSEVDISEGLAVLDPRTPRREM